MPWVPFTGPTHLALLATFTRTYPQHVAHIPTAHHCRYAALPRIPSRSLPRLPLLRAARTPSAAHATTAARTCTPGADSRQSHLGREPRWTCAPGSLPVSPVFATLCVAGRVRAHCLPSRTLYLPPASTHYRAHAVGRTLHVFAPFTTTPRRAPAAAPRRVALPTPTTLSPSTGQALYAGHRFAFCAQARGFFRSLWLRAY